MVRDTTLKLSLNLLGHLRMLLPIIIMTVILCALIVIGANILGHILPPFSIFGSPVYMPLIIAFTCRDFSKNIFFQPAFSLALYFC